MKHKRSLLFILTLSYILFVCSTCLDSKTMSKEKRIEHSNHFSKKTVSSIFHDTKGNWWFACKDEGVYKYNGTLLSLIDTTHGLCSNNIIDIQEDKIGNIFFNTADCINKFDGNEFSTLEVSDYVISESQWISSPDDLWFNMGWNHDGPFRYDGEVLHSLKFPHTRQYEEFYEQYPNASFSPYGIYEIYKDSKGAIWFGTSSAGIFRFDGDSIKWMNEAHQSTTPSGVAFGIRSIIEDKEGLFWICNDNYKYKIKPTKSNSLSELQFEKIEINNSIQSSEEAIYFMSMTKDSKGNIWMASYDEGVWKFDGIKLSFYPVQKGKSNVNLLCIYADHDDTIWLGSSDDGILKLVQDKFVPFDLN